MAEKESTLNKQVRFVNVVNARRFRRRTSKDLKNAWYSTEDYKKFAEDRKLVCDVVRYTECWCLTETITGHACHGLESLLDRSKISDDNNYG